MLIFTHFTICLDMENTYFQYYTIQTGAGLKDIGPLYYNSRFIQQGSGFGGVFASLYRFFKPMIQSGLSTLQNQAIKTGASILSEVGTRPLKEVLIENGKKARDELQTKFKNKFQEGKGLLFAGAARRKTKKCINAKRKKNRAQSKSKRTKLKSNKSVRTIDIFSK